MKLFKRNEPRTTPAGKVAGWRAAYENGGRLKLASAISAECARLVTLEFKSRIHGTQRAELLNSAYADVVGRARSFCETACALGGVMLKPYVADGRLYTAYVPADSFVVTKIAPDGSICGVKFFERTELDGRLYKKCEEHIFDGGDYHITNTAYLCRGGSEGEVPLSEVPEWADFEPEVYFTNVKAPMFAYLRMPFADPSDLTSPLGAPVFARAGALIEDAERQYERLLWEFESGERALYIDETAMRRNMFGEMLLPEHRLYRMLNTGNDELFMDWSPEIRDEALINGFERILQRIEFNCGLAYGTLSDPQSVEKTAEEIRASRQRSYATITEIQTALKAALTGWAEAADILCSIYGLAPEGEYSIDFEFDDSIVAPRTTEFSERMQLLNAGVITSEEMRAWYLGEEYIGRKTDE